MPEILPSPEHTTPLPIEVGMKEWRKSDSNQPVVETKGLGPCIGVAVWDSASKIGHMYHVARPTFEQEQIPAFLSSIRESSPDSETLKVWLRGGQKSGNTAIVDFDQDERDYALGVLQSTLNVKDSQMDVVWDESPVGSQGTRMQLDTRTGEFLAEVRPFPQTAQDIGKISLTAL